MKLNKDKIYKHKSARENMKKGLVLFVLLIISIVGVISLVSAECSDSDNGINYYSKGSAQDSNQTISDMCVADNPKQLSEAYCEDGIAKSVKYDCPNGCSEGACLCPTTKCSDGTTYGPEKCNIKDNICECPSCAPTRPIICSAMPTCEGAKDTGQKDSNGCPIYSCQATSICSDSDGGVYEFLKGKISDNNGKVYEDFCIVAGGTFKYVNEYYCDSGIVNSKVIECANSCSDGACITSTQCSSNSDCPMSYGKQYCDGNNACTSTSIYSCVSGKCVISSGGGTCQTCPSGCYNGVCMQGDVKEQINCIFSGSTQLQKCYTAEQNSRGYCSGTESCVAGILGYKGEKITWKSTCGGYAYTIMDGVDEYAKFDCSVTGVCQPSKCDDGTITECKIDNGQCICSTCQPIIIKPVCGNGICESGEGEVCAAIAMSCEIGKECKVPPAICSIVCPQDCKITEPIYPDLNDKFKLQVYQTAKIMENKNAIMKISFRDLMIYKCEQTTTNSEATETIESKITIATGMVVASTETATTSTTSAGGGGTVPSTPTTTTEVLKCTGAGPTAVLSVDMIVNSEISTSTILNLNVGEKKQVGEFTISFLGYDYASRTGIFVVSRETFSCPERCKCDENGKVIECAKKCEKGKTLCPDGICRDKCEIITEDCKYGCSYDGKCFPMSVRSSGMYCGTELFMSSQKASDEKCDNNFECSSNVCVSGKCISSGLIRKIIEFFKNIFGGE